MQHMSRRAVLATAGLLAGGTALRASAQSGYPNRTVTLISPAAPGSQTDVFSRALAVPLSQRLGKSVVIENRPGAGGLVGTQTLVRAAPDGHTLLYASNSGFLISPNLRRPPPFETPRDLAPIAITLSGPSVIVVGRKVSAGTIQDFVAELRANPGKYNLGSHGVGAFSHVAMEMFMGETRTEMVHVPYNGGGPLGAAFMAGDVDVALLDVLTARPLVDSGRGRVLATVGERRSPVYADAPLVAETVAPNLAMDFWLGIFAPAGTPAEIIERLHADINEVTRSPEGRSRAAENSMLTEPLPLPELRAKIAREWAEWQRVIRERNIAGS
jgi:tripartite-type tricarboxylate transporter receptor subunit TctC